MICASAINIMSLDTTEAISLGCASTGVSPSACGRTWFFNNMQSKTWSMPLASTKKNFVSIERPQQRQIKSRLRADKETLQRKLFGRRKPLNTHETNSKSMYKAPLFLSKPSLLTSTLLPLLLQAQFRSQLPTSLSADTQARQSSRQLHGPSTVQAVDVFWTCFPQRVTGLRQCLIISVGVWLGFVRVSVWWVSGRFWRWLIYCHPSHSPCWLLLIMMNVQLVGSHHGFWGAVFWFSFLGAFNWLLGFEGTVLPCGSNGFCVAL